MLTNQISKNKLNSKKSINFKSNNSGASTSKQKNTAQEMRATREGFGEGLLIAAKENEKVYAITADLATSVGMGKFSEEYPLRFVDVGVAEQNLVTVASGLAMAGKIPFAAAFAAFSPGRNYEQIRTTIAYNNQNVIVVGSHAGLGVGEDGATHQALEDVALMRTIPNMTIIVPCDANQAKLATIELAKKPRIAYLRVFRQKSQAITNQHFEIGKAQVLKEGRDICIISNGPIIKNVIDAVKLLEKNKISCTIINCHTIKPLDVGTILKHAHSASLIVTVEDHQIIGGLGDAIAHLLSTRMSKRMLILGVNDTFGESGSDVELYKKHGLDASGIANSIIAEHKKNNATRISHVKDNKQNVKKAKKVIMKKRNTAKLAKTARNLKKAKKVIIKKPKIMRRNK